MNSAIAIRTSKSAVVNLEVIASTVAFKKDGLYTVTSTRSMPWVCRIYTLHTFGSRYYEETDSSADFLSASKLPYRSRPVNPNSSTMTRPSTAMRGDHEQVRI
jgi:hypothetical protein